MELVCVEYILLFKNKGTFLQVYKAENLNGQLEWEEDEAEKPDKIRFLKND